MNHVVDDERVTNQPATQWESAVDATPRDTHVFAVLFGFAVLYRYSLGFEELMSKAYRRGL